MTRDDIAQRQGQIRYDAAPRMVQVRHGRRESGYSVIAASNIDSGSEVGFYDELSDARARAKALIAKPERWIGGVVMPVAVYNVSDLRIVERY